MQRIYDFGAQVQNQEGRNYLARLYGSQRIDRHWIGLLVFVPEDEGPILGTGIETVQADTNALLYWAGGLTPTYLQGALARAAPHDSPQNAAV